MEENLNFLFNKYINYYAKKEYAEIIMNFNNLDFKLKNKVLKSDEFADLIFESLLNLNEGINNSYISYYVFYRKNVNQNLIHDFIFLLSKSANQKKDENPYLDSTLLIKSLINKRPEIFEEYDISLLGDSNFDASPRIKTYLPKFSADYLWILIYLVIAYFILIPIPFLYESLITIYFLLFISSILGYFFNNFQILFYKYFIFRIFYFYYFKSIFFLFFKIYTKKAIGLST